MKLSGHTKKPAFVCRQETIIGPCGYSCATLRGLMNHFATAHRRRSTVTAQQLELGGV